MEKKDLRGTCLSILAAAYIIGIPILMLCEIENTINQLFILAYILSAMICLVGVAIFGN